MDTYFQIGVIVLITIISEKYRKPGENRAFLLNEKISQHEVA
jgi:hypothetical protein